MVVVDDLRKPLPIKNLIDRFGFRLRGHVKITVVVVSCVLLVKPRQIGRRAFLGISLTHVPVRHQLQTIRIDACRQKYRVIEKPERFIVRVTDHPVNKFHQLLGAQHLGRMEAPVNPHDGTPLPGQLSRIIL